MCEAMATWPPARSKLKIKLQMYLFNNGILQKKLWGNWGNSAIEVQFLPLCKKKRTKSLIRNGRK